MKIIVFALGFLLISSLNACSPKANNDLLQTGTGAQVESKAQRADEATLEASQRKNPLFIERNEIGRRNFPLSIKGQKALPVFLEKIGLSNILSLNEVDGIKKLDKQTCEEIFKKFRTENPTKDIKGAQCEWNLDEDDTYVDVDPLAFSLSELDGKYLLLFIDEEGLGAPGLFTYLYNLDRKKVLSFSRAPLGETIAYYHDNLLYFVNAAGFLELTYDLNAMKPILIQQPDL